MVMPWSHIRNNTAFPNPHMFPLFGTSVFRLCSESDSLQTHKGFLSTLSSFIFSCHLVLVPPYSVKLQFYFSLFNYSPVSFLHHQTLGVYGLDFLLLFFSPLTLSSTLCNLDFPSETTCLEKVACDHLLTKSHGLFSVLILFALCSMVTSIISWQWC